MKVLLVHPPHTRLRRSGPDAFFPLGLGYLAGTLAAAGHEPLIYSAEHAPPGEPLPRVGMREVFHHRSEGHHNGVRALADDDHPVWREVRAVLDRVRPEVVGITALSVQFGAAARIAELVKRWQPEVPVVLGGHHVTYLPRDALRQAPAVDLAVLGEGELTLVELVDALQAGGDPTSIPGLAWLHDGALHTSARRHLIEDLDALPFPRKDLVLFPERYHPSHFASLILGRGCPWRCRFCSSKSFWDRRTRMRSPASCLDEIRALMSTHGLADFMFWDDAFTVSRGVVLDFCQAAAQADLGFTFRTATRADLLDDELAGALRRAGCVRLSLGVETGSPRVSRMIAKDLDLDALRAGVRTVRRHGMGLGVFFMAGFPRETADDLRMTRDLIRELGADEVAFNVFDPMPGSGLYDDCVELGLVEPEADWRTFPLWPDAYYLAAIDRGEFDRLAHEIADEVFRRNEGLLGKIRQNLPLLRRNPRAAARKLARRISASRDDA